MTPTPAGLRDLRRVLTAHRRLLAAGLAGGAVAAGLAAVETEPGPTVPVLAAARDLQGGVPLSPDDLTTVRLPADAVPAGALVEAADVSGRTLAGPVRRGEALTDVRLLGPALLAASGESAETVAAPVRIADPGAVALLRPGDVVDVLAATPDAGSAAARTIVSGSRVLAIPREDGTSALAEGALVVLATTPRVAADLARAAVDSRLSITLRAPA